MLQRGTLEIRKLALFRDMQDESFEMLTRGAYLQTFPPHIDLIREGDPSDFLHVIIEGLVALTASWSGRATVMQIVRPVSTFILAASLEDAPNLMSACTVARSRVVLIPSTDVRAVFEVDPAFARAVVTELAQCYRGAIKHTKDLKLRNSQERLANWVLREQTRVEGAATFNLPVEKRRLAGYLAMTPENLSRGLKALERHGVTVQGPRLTLNDNAALTHRARPDRLIDDPAY